MNIRLLAFLVIISTHVLSSAQVKISGSIIGVESYQTVSIVSLDTNKKIATCPINSSGEFRFEFSVGSTGFYKLEFENEYTIALIISPNDLITLKLYADDTSKPTITGSPETARLYQANIQVSEFNEKEEDLLSEYDQNRQARRSYILEQIRKDPSSLVNFYFFDYLDPNEDRLVIESMVKRMYARYPKNPMVKDLWTKMKLPRAKDNQVLPEIKKNNERPLVGVMADDILSTTPNDTPLKLSSLRGKVVLLEFWASWCTPCVKKNEKLKVLYQKYKSRGFEIFAVGLEKNKIDWINAIQDQKLPWLQVSDLKYWQPQSLRNFSVNSVPYSVLIDKSGYIIARNVSDSDLERFIVEGIEHK